MNANPYMTAIPTSVTTSGNGNGNGNNNNNNVDDLIDGESPIWNEVLCKQYNGRSVMMMMMMMMMLSKDIVFITTITVVIIVFHYSLIFTLPSS